MAEIGVSLPSPQLTPEIEAFLAADEELKRASGAAVTPS
jgi:hypothetical protein